MSTVVMAACWPLQMSATNKAVLISLADQANDQGACWPALSTLCERTCLRERAVRIALRWLEAERLIETDVRRKRDGSMTSNLYTVRLDACRALVKRQEEGPAAAAAGCGVVPRGDDGARAESAPATGTSCPTPPACDAPPPRHVMPHPPACDAPPPGTTCPLTIIEPTQEPNTPPTPLQGADGVDLIGSTPPAKGDGLIGLKAMLQLCRERGERAIPEHDPVFAYCDRVGIGRDILALHWHEFKRRRLDANKRQRGVDGWRKAFQNSVRDNWYRLWVIRPGEAAQLTTVGLQALVDKQAADDEAARQRQLIDSEQGGDHG